MACRDNDCTMVCVADDYYVYLLVDHDPRGKRADRIFYVGKGRNSRALHHVLEYVAALERRAFDAARESLEKSGGIEPEHSHQDLSSVENDKIKCIDAIRSSGRDVRIDVLRAGLSNAVAYTVESAAIDVLGVGTLANKVAGHEHFRAPAAAVSKMLDAIDVDIDEPALQVTVTERQGRPACDLR